jgi:hypothetical protein
LFLSDSGSGQKAKNEGFSSRGKLIVMGNKPKPLNIQVFIWLKVVPSHPNYFEHN